MREAISEGKKLLTSCSGPGRVQLPYQRRAGGGALIYEEV